MADVVHHIMLQSLLPANETLKSVSIATVREVAPAHLQQQVRWQCHLCKNAIGTIVQFLQKSTTSRLSKHSNKTIWVVFSFDRASCNRALVHLTIACAHIRAEAWSCTGVSPGSSTQGCGSAGVLPCWRDSSWDDPLALRLPCFGWLPHQPAGNRKRDFSPALHKYLTSNIDLSLLLHVHYSSFSEWNKLLYVRSVEPFTGIKSRHNSKMWSYFVQASQSNWKTSM